MKTWMRLITLLLATWLLAACGGGGGCAGTTSDGINTCGATGTVPVTPSPKAPTSTIFFTNSTVTFAPLAQNNVTSTPNTYAVVTLLDGNAAPLANQLISFTTDNTIAALASASALTDANGRAWVRIQPASLTTSGAGILTATVTVAGQTVTTSQGYQVAASNVVLGTMTISPGSITALATASVSVPVTVNGTPASAGQVNVTLQAACGYFNKPGATTLSVPTSFNGNATAPWTSESVCGGSNVIITATATGASSPSTGVVTVAPVAAANLLYVGADTSTLVVTQNPSGIKQSTLTFKVVDGSNIGLANQAITFGLDTVSVNAGVTLINNVGTTQNDGTVKVIISSGSLPTPVSVTAALTNVPTMKASSFGLAVTTGKPSQSYTSISASKFNIQGYAADGATTTVTLRAADRMGNPPPLNTAVTFSTGFGNITGSCLTDATGACSVTFISGGMRPKDGIVTILATLVGEERFYDANGNNVYDPGEKFDDLGQPYRDDDHNGKYTLIPAEQKIGTPTGGLPCPDETLSVTDTCDNKWTETTLVRQQLQIGLSGPTAQIEVVPPPPPGSSVTQSGFKVRVSDLATGGAVGMAAGTTIKAVTDNINCVVVSPSVGAPQAVPNQIGSSMHDIALGGGAACSKVQVFVTVTAPDGTQTIKVVPVP